MNYKIVDQALIETRTESVVFKSNDMNALRDKKRLLNMGAGFDGFTPSFLLSSLKTS